MELKEIFLNKLKIETKQVSIDSLFNDEGEVKKTRYNPPYQRNYVWDSEKATYFLESILIGTEIPPLVFFKSGLRREIIDGRQRYETILKFLHGELRLKKSGLKKLDVLKIDKKTFSDLTDEMKNDFLETQLRIIEFSFASYEGTTSKDEESVKQEIFKRYNSGITPLKGVDIEKAKYFENDLNAFFKDKLKDKTFYDLFTSLFRYEDKRIEISLKKIRQLLVLHKVPIKYYSIAKQKVTDKYYDLLSSQIKEENFETLYVSFKQKLELINLVKERLEAVNLQYNRLISEVLFWAFSIIEDNTEEDNTEEDNTEENSIDYLFKIDSFDILGFVDLITNNISAFKMDRSSFANEIVTRYKIVADYLNTKYKINTYSYVITSKDFIRENRDLSLPQVSDPVNYQNLRINKPDPTTYTIKDMCRKMDRDRFLVRPAYQREEVTNRKKRSKIIESILLGIKLPPIFVFKNDDGVSEVMDGQQRILSILAFLGKDYKNETGEIVKTQKDKFKLQLKNSILKDLDGKCYDELDEVLQDTIASFGLWVIEINHKYNPTFEPLDLFIRLNNRPYPIKDDTFEMWNSYIDRGLIESIKTSYADNNWFSMRKTGNRMENENNYTVLSYFTYLELNSDKVSREGLELNPDRVSIEGTLDIYKMGSRIAFRLRPRVKRDISTILEDPGKKDAFIDAVNCFEFSFIRNLRTLLTDNQDESDNILKKNLDEFLGVVESGKRTQQSFYVLWYFLRGLDCKNVVGYNKQIRQEVRQLFNAMTLDISVEEFKSKVEKFRNEYKIEGKREFFSGRIKDVAELDVSMDIDKIDFYVKCDNKERRRIYVAFEKPESREGYMAICMKREGIEAGYLAAIIQSSFLFLEYDFNVKRASVNNLKNILIPILPLEKQRTFVKLLAYTWTKNDVQRMFFESVLDRLVDEVYHHDVFESQNVSLLNQVDRLDNLKELNDVQRQSQIDRTYYSIIKEKGGLFSELLAATGVSGSLGYEKN